MKIWEIGMTHDLDRLLERLRTAPADHALGGLARDIDARIAATAANRQTWGLRAAAVGLVTASGIAINASTAAIGAPEPPSALAIWSQLAPATLLEHGR
jgi:hypothetical protein